MPRKFIVRCTVDVEITVNDPDVFKRITGPKGDEWRGDFYPLRSENNVLEHFAHNAVYNHVLQARELEGWADVDRKAAWFAVHEPDDFECSEVKP